MIAIRTLTALADQELIAINRTELDRMIAIAGHTVEDAADVAADVAAYDAAKAEFEASGAVAFPPELSALLLKHKSRLAAARRWRGLSQAELAARADIRQGYLSDLESRRRKGLAATLERLATVLGVPVDWIG